MMDELPLDDEQLKVVGLVGVVVLAMVGAPMLLTPSDDEEIEPNNGTIVTPDGTTLEEVNDPDRGPLAGLNAIPSSHVRDDESPTVMCPVVREVQRRLAVDGRRFDPHRRAL
ncbi:hypothetical protein DJ82_00685, partial [Halorubrum sp. Ib24]|uniref:hypothetical protein n=1 Tax=Halorubrum sp. Ib24 TaxID=1383850 RepID=UPI000BD8203D